jgi:hypothetical protein
VALSKPPDLNPTVGEGREMVPHRLGFRRRISGEVAAQEQTTATFSMFPEVMERSTRCVWMRGSRWCPPRARLRPRELAGSERRAPGGGILLATLRSSICFGIKRETRSGRCYRSWGKYWEKEEGADLLGSVGFDRDVCRSGGIPTSNSASLAARSAGEGRGEWRGGVGLFIGVVEASNYAGSKGIEEGKGSYCERRKRSC